MTQQERIQQSNGTGRRVHRIHRRKLDILRVSARLFAERGYERTTLEMIAKEKLRLSNHKKTSAVVY